MQVLHSHMKKEIDSCQSTLTAYDLVKTRGMRRISICLMAVWSDNSSCFYLSTCCAPVHYNVPVCCPVYSSAFFPVSITSCLPVQLPNCPVDVLFSCLNIFLFTRLLVFTPSLVLKSNCASAIVCLLLQVCHQFCVLRFGDGLAEVRGESPH